jgi:hypothetical protein
MERHSIDLEQRSIYVDSTKSYRAPSGLERRSRDATPASSEGSYPMKRISIWIFYGIGALAIAYLALYAYAAFTGRGVELENPIHIFRRPDAPDYS